MLLAAIACAPLFADVGFFLTRGVGDSANLLFRVHQLLTAYAAGDFPARWMPDGAYGYGLPYFTYYASFSTHVAAWFKLAGFSYATAIKLAQVAALAFGAWAAYGWLESSQSPRPEKASAWSLAARPLAGAIAYTFAPFHLVNIYARGDSLAELWAMALTPAVLWSVERFGARRSFGRAAALAVVIAAAICTHNVSALMTLPFIGLYAVLRLGSASPGPRWRVWGGALATAVWGLALSAFFWAPALGEVGAVQLTALTNGYFSYTGHFRAGDLLQLGWIFDYGPGVFAMGLVQTLAAAAGLFAWLARRRFGWREAFVLVGLGASTFLITPWSEPLYAHVPGLAYIQFPWRFLGVQALFLAALTGWLWPEDARLDLSLWRKQAVSIGCMLVLGFVMAASVLAGLRLEFVPLADEELTTGRLNLFEQATSMIGNTANAEYLPIAVDPRPWTSPTLLGQAPRPVALSGVVTGERLARMGARETWALAAEGPARVALPTYWWPGWTARVDDAPVPTTAADGLGFIAFDLPPGAHTVTLALTDTPLRAAANLLSLLAGLGPLAGYALWLRRSRRAWAMSGGARLALGLCVAVVLLPVPGALAQAANGAARVGGWDVVPQAWAGREDLEAQPLNYDSVVLAFPHRDRLRFATGAELIGMRMTPVQPRPGETVHVRLDWRAAYPAIVTLTLWPPSAPVLPEAAPVLTATLPVNVLNTAAELSQAEFTFTLPPALAPGVYWWTIDLVGDGGPVTSVTASGRERGRVYLNPFVIDTPTPAPDTRLADLGPLRLHAVTAQVRGDRVDIGALWSAVRPVGEDLALSLRLFDPAGARVDQRDGQPGDGFAPTHAWEPGIAISTTVSLALPDDPAAGLYRLEIVAYRSRTLEPVGTTTLPVALIPSTPRGERVARWVLTPTLGLEGLDLPATVEAGTTLQLAVHWLTGSPAPLDRPFWSLIGPDGGEVAAIVEDLPGAAGWPSAAAVRGVVALPVPASLSAGDYDLRVQAGADGQPQVVARVAVTASTRVFELPPLQQYVGANYGDVIALAGYDLEMDGTMLELALVFQALQAPVDNFKYFVHIVEPTTGALVAQVDAEPGAFLRPTSGWVAGEVVREPVVIDLADVAAGRYQIMVGWYDPAQPGAPRLPARDAGGVRSPDDRIVLPDLAVRP